MLFVLLALLVAAGGILSAQTFKNVTVIKNSFDDGKVGGWAHRGHPGSEEKLIIDTAVKKVGSASLKITNRTKTWHGPIHLLTDNAVAGDVYAFSGWIYYNQGPENQAFTFSVERSFKDPNEAHKYANILSFQAKKGEWTQIKGEYTVGADPTQKNIWVYFELPYKADDLVTANDQIDFWVDEIEFIKLDPALKPKVQLDIPNLGDTLYDWFSIGTAVNPDEVDPSQQKAQLIMKHFNALVAGNAHKMDAIQPQEGKFEWRDADRIVEFGMLTGMRVRWHSLQWHQQAPAWLMQDPKDPNKRVSKDLLNQRLKTHIQTIVKRYKGQVESYDVVNEVLSDKGGFRTAAEGSLWYDILGKEFIFNSFKWAREADPYAQLVINDYNLESDKRKRQDMYNLVKEMLAAKVPVDAVGIQMHISNTAPSVAEIKETIDLFASLGVQVVITEMDMSIYASANDAKRIPTANDLLVQAQRYKDIFAVYKAAAEKGQLDLVMIWGPSDDTSWLNDFPVRGRTDAPLLFDTRFQAKPAFWAIVDPSKVKGLR